MCILSVIIPTHNRASCAIHTIKSVLSLSDKVQVVVCDSSQIDEISSYFAEWNDESRLKIIRSNECISVVDNFNLALRSADGEYLVFIGDDDFVSFDIVTLAEWAKSHGVDSLKLNFPALYYWPDFKHASRGDIYSGTLHIAPFSGEIHEHETSTTLSYALDNFGGGVFDMPRAYAGMISSSLVKNILEKYGDLFGGVSPDIYSSAIISVEAKKCMLVDYPIVIPGASGISTTGQSNSGGHYGSLRENPHIAPFKNLVWDERIPEFYSVPTVWSYSLLKAIELLVEKNSELKFSPNFGRLLLKCFLYHPGSYQESFIALKKLSRDYGWRKILFQIFSSVGSEFLWGAGRIMRRFNERHLKNTIDTIKELETTRAASVALEEYFKSNNKKLIV